MKYAGRIAILFTAILASLEIVSPLQAQVSSSDLANIGLDVAWRAQVIQGSSSGTPVSVTLFPHPTKRKQSVTIVANGRVIEQISAEAVDRVAYEQQIAKLESFAKSTEKKITLPRIGLEGARLVADKTEARLKLLGRQYERIEIDEPMIYLVTVSSDGSIQAFNAETGESLWATSVGRMDRLTLPAGVSEDYVSIVNGGDLHLLRLSDGTTVNTRKLLLPNVAGSIPVGPWVYVPGISGSLIAYNATNKEALPWRSVSGGTSTEIPVVSLDGKFIAWNAAPKFLNLTRVDGKKPSPWNRLESSDPLRTQPVAIPGGFIVVTSEGGVTRLGIPTEENSKVRNDAISWRSNSGVYNASTPIVANGLVLVWSFSSGLVAIDENSGVLAWRNPVSNVAQVIGASASSIYCRTKEDRLVVLDAKTGELQRSLARTVPNAISNSINDRLYFVTSSGQIVCVREHDSLQPSPLHPESSVASKGKPKAANPSTEKSNGPPAEDPFGTGMEPIERTPAQPTADDPFGGSTNDPFGGAAEPAKEPAGGNNGAAIDPNNPFG